MSSGNIQIRKAAWKRKKKKKNFARGWQTNTRGEVQMNNYRGPGTMKVLIFSENTMGRQDSACKHNGSQRWGLGVGLMAGVGGHWIPMTKYWKKDVWLEFSLAELGGLHAWQTHYVPDELTGAEYKKRLLVEEAHTVYTLHYIKDREISNTKANIQIPSSVELVSHMEPVIASLSFSTALFFLLVHECLLTKFIDRVSKMLRWNDFLQCKDSVISLDYDNIWIQTDSSNSIF